MADETSAKPFLAPPASFECHCQVKCEDNGGKGRYVIAKKRLKRGEIVLEECPAAAVVGDVYREVACARCLRFFTEQILLCGGCKSNYYCSQECLTVDSSIHAIECPILVKFSRLQIEGESEAMRLSIRLAILQSRKKLMEQQYPSDPTKALSLDHHYERVDEVTQHGLLTVGKALAELAKDSSSTTSAKGMVQLLLMIQCNAHGIRTTDGHVVGLGLFPFASMLNHSCQPTAQHTFSLLPLPSTTNGSPQHQQQHLLRLPKITFRTLEELKEGQEIAYSYTDLMRSGSIRRRILSSAYYFACDCSRCRWTLSPSSSSLIEGGEDAGTEVIKARAKEGVDNKEEYLAEWALESLACHSLHQGDDEEDDEDESKSDEAISLISSSISCPGVFIKSLTKDNRWICSSCGKETDESIISSKIESATFTLQTMLQAIQQQPQQQQQVEGGGIGESDLILLDKIQPVVDLLFVPNRLHLHRQHWLVYQALAVISVQLSKKKKTASAAATAAAAAKEEEEEDRHEMYDLTWIRAAVEVWALYNLRRITGTKMYPELGQRLISAGEALLALSVAKRKREKGEGGFKSSGLGRWRWPREEERKVMECFVGG